MKKGMFALAVAAATGSGAFLACSNATNGDTGLPDAATGSDGSGSSSSGSSGGGGSGSSSGSSGGGSGSSSGGSSSGGDGGVDTAQVVINEISGKSVNWVELYNAGTATLDLGGYGVTREQKDGGGIATDDTATFPSGTMLAPGQYAVVAQLPVDAGADATPVCPDGGQAFCLGCTFGISNSDGTTIYVLDPSQNVSSQAPYPANTVQAGQTWGRIPNGTGTFQTNLPTPGAANVAN